MEDKLPKLSLKFVTLLLLLAGLGLSVGLSMERQVVQKQAAEDESTPQASEDLTSEVSTDGTCSVDEPDQPQNLRAWPGPEEGQVSLVWDPVSQAEDYLIQYSDDFSFWRFQVSNLGQVQTYIASELDPGADYYFWISAVNECAQSEHSNILIVKSYTEGVDTSVVYADQIDQGQFNIREITPSEEQQSRTSEEMISESDNEASVTSEVKSPNTSEVEESEAQLETEPRILDQPEEAKTTININWQQILTQAGPWILGVAAIWGVVTIIKSRINQVSSETEDLSKGTEISLEEVKTKSDSDTSGVNSSPSNQPDYGPRPPVEPPKD